MSLSFIFYLQFFSYLQLLFIPTFFLLLHILFHISSISFLSLYWTSNIRVKCYQATKKLKIGHSLLIFFLFLISFILFLLNFFVSNFCPFSWRDHMRSKYYNLHCPIYKGIKIFFSVNPFFVCQLSYLGLSFWNRILFWKY